MACPHVSGVVALGLSYAAKNNIHVKAEEVKALLHSTARPIEQYWNMDELKYYYKFVTDLSEVHFASMDLKSYKGKMGHGQVDAHAFLQAIKGAGTPMTFPNVYVAEGGSVTLAPAMYFKNSAGQTFNVSITDQSVASCTQDGKNLKFEGLKEGQTSAKITSSGGASFDFTITVRATANGNGWL